MTQKKEIKKTKPMLETELTELLFSTGMTLAKVCEEKFGKAYAKLSLEEINDLVEHLKSIKTKVIE